MPFTPPPEYPYSDDSSPGANDGDIVYAGIVNAIMEYLDEDLPTDILAAGSVSLSNATPQDLGTAAAGVATAASRADHVHDMPTAAQVGAATSTDITNAINAHVAATDPHGDRAYADSLFDQLNTTDYQGTIDASTNPNYPAADADHAYRVVAAGKLGGASGVDVEIGDLAICLTDGTPSGTQAAVGSNWTIVQNNLNGAVIGPATSTNDRIALFSGTTGKLIKQASVTVDDLTNGPRIIQVAVTDPNGDVLTTGDGKAWVFIPAELNTHVLTAAVAAVTTVSSSGTPTVQLARVRAGSPVDMLSTRITIDANETSSTTAATPAVINTSNDDVATGDFIRVDIDVAGTGTKGLIVTMTFAEP